MSSCMYGLASVCASSALANYLISIFPLSFKSHKMSAARSFVVIHLAAFCRRCCRRIEKEFSSERNRVEFIENVRQ
jgi:hypothetical protein